MINAKILGNEIHISIYGNNFQEDLAKVKNLPKRVWDKDRKIWIVPINDIELANSHLNLKLLAPSNQQDLRQIKYGEVVLYPFQQEGVKFLINSKQCVLADDTGTGKTIQVISAIKELGARKIIVVCPNIAKENWKRELIRMGEVDVNIFNGRQLIACKWTITNYEKLRKIIDGVGFDCVVGDEAHAIKHFKAQRTQNFFRLFDNESIKYKFLLTGTPITNKIVDLFNLLKIVDKERFSRWWDFAYRYANIERTEFGTNFYGVRNVDELKSRLKPIFIRREKKEVLQDLPEITRTYLPVEIKNRKEYEKAEKEFLKYLLDKYGYIKYDKAIRAEVVVKMTELRKITTEGKLGEIMEFIDILEPQKMIVYSTFKFPLERIYGRFKDKSALLIGDIGEEERQTAIGSFVQDDKNILLATMSLGGQALNLQVANYVLFCDMDWVPTNHVQAEGRAYRMGTKNAITVYYCYSQNTIDEYMSKVLAKKIETIGDLLGEGSITDMVIDEFMLKIEARKHE